jgi:hypothetical protein
MINFELKHSQIWPGETSSSTHLCLFEVSLLYFEHKIQYFLAQVIHTSYIPSAFLESVILSRSPGSLVENGTECKIWGPYCYLQLMIMFSFFYVFWKSYSFVELCLPLVLNIIIGMWICSINKKKRKSFLCPYLAFFWLNYIFVIPLSFFLPC